MVTTTTQYSFQKPTVGDDEDVWGGYLNSNFDSIDSLLRGSTALSTINVTGNITVGGTVDGRDVASDGTKLDGIEAGATADQTAAEIRSLVESATDSNVFTDADHTKLNGIEAGATADQTKADIDALGIAASTASTLATARNIAVTGAVTGNANFDGSGNISIATTATSDPTVTLTGAVTGSGTMTNLGNVSIATTATADPTLTLNGDVSGSATFTNLGNATLTVTVADDSHNHVISNVDGLQTALDGKLSTSGKAADSNLLDGIDSSAFLRSNTNDTMSGTLTLSQDGQDVLNFSANDTNDARGISFNNRSALTADYNDGWLRLNQLSEFTNGIYTPSLLRVDGALEVASVIQHQGDTDTNISFGTNTITLATGGSSEITVNTTGVRLGDTGNGYFQPVSGNYGSIQIDGGAHSGYEGYSIGGRAVFMHNNSATMGLYDDVNNDWAFTYDFNGTAQLYHNGASKLDTLSNGVSINGNLYTDGSNAEDWDSLSGTTPTCNVDNAGAFSLTMTGNTTFTFSGADSGWSMGFVLQLTGNGSTVTWPASVDWAGGTAPDAPASGETDIYVFWTRDGGTTWYGVQSIDAAA